jgi:putative ABC transport system substrate-binding protein
MRALPRLRSPITCRHAAALDRVSRPGGAISLGPDLAAIARQGASYIDKIIHGSKPGDLPVQQPERYLKTAKMLGLNIPPSLFARADEVIE